MKTHSTRVVTSQINMEIEVAFMLAKEVLQKTGATQKIKEITRKRYQAKSEQDKRMLAFELGLILIQANPKILYGDTLTRLYGHTSVLKRYNTITKN